MNYIKQAIVGKWSGHSEYYVSPKTAWFYRLKAVICLAINREPNRKINVAMESVLVTCTDGGSSYIPGEPTVHWFEGIAVGYGILHGWWATIYEDSN